MADRPNILLLFTDQQRADTIGALGHPVIQTPHLDRLAKEGTTFTRAYTPSPVCVSARCSLYWGQYPFNTGCYDNGFGMPVDRPSMFQCLTDAGYRTHAMGKLHFAPDSHALNGLQSRHTQEELIGDRKKDDYHRYLMDNGLDYITDPHGVRGEMYYVPQPAQMPAEHHPTNWLGSRAVEFINEQPDEQPWFLYAGFIHPHPPFAPPVPWHKLYRGPMMPLPKTPPGYESLYTWYNRRQNRYKYRDQGLDMNLIRIMRAYYFACISFIDFQVGRILQTLEETGQLDSTLILYSSDHGEYLGDYGCFGKRGMMDAPANVPLLARLPGRFEAGRQVGSPASLVDIMPTALNIAQADHPDGLDGVDLAEVANGNTDRQYVYSQLNKGGHALYMAADERWKFIYSAPDHREYLFDRKTDPDEMRSKIDIPPVREEQARMKRALVEKLQAVGETSGLDGDDFKRLQGPTIDKNPDAGQIFQDHGWADEHIPGYSN